MQKKHKEKIKKGREQYLEKENGLVCKINDRLEIWVDRHQYILRIDNNKNRDTYFTSVDHIFDELLLIKEKEFMLAKKAKNIQSVKDSVDESKKWLEDIVKPLFK
jgi:hypothetical protein